MSAESSAEPSGQPCGRFAPSPTGALHIGNLRTALLSWLHARARGGRWIVRMEDLDRLTASRGHEDDQLRSLAMLGMTWDGPVVRQSERFALYREAIRLLQMQRLVYPCFCTRREIREAAKAPHGASPDGAYPGTCRTLSDSDRQRLEREGRRPALRLRADGASIEVHDLLAGVYRGAVDDVVLQRNDGIPAYNLAVVVDDAAQGVTDVVRGDDLLESTPRQILLQGLLGLPTPRYAHVPLVLAPDGSRLAKRHGAVTLADLAQRGVDAPAVLARLGASLGLCEPDDAIAIADLLVGFSLDAIPRRPWQLSAADL